MKDSEALGLLVMSYSWDRDYKNKGWECESMKQNQKSFMPDIALMKGATEFLTRKGYFFSIRHPLYGHPTRKTFKLLQRWGVYLKTIKEKQIEFAKKGYVIFLDKEGNEHKV